MESNGVIILNEKSLDGQFESVDAFCKTLPVMSRNLKTIRQTKLALLKHSSLFQRKITRDITLLDMRNKGHVLAPGARDYMRQWKRELSSLMDDPPFWDADMAESHDSLTEAAKRDVDTLAFLHREYKDCIKFVEYQGKPCKVRSSYGTEYLVEGMYERGYLDDVQYVKMRFQFGRLRMEHVQEDDIHALEKQEFNELVDALCRFDAKENWGEISADRYFNYKPYQSPKKKDVFAGGPYEGKPITKFRCGQHSQVRCFGYRENEVFYVLRIERDHSISDNG